MTCHHRSWGAEAWVRRIMGQMRELVGGTGKRDDGMDDWNLNLRRLTSSEELAEEEWVNVVWGWRMG